MDQQIVRDEVDEIVRDVIEALEAGLIAGNNAIPEPMTVIDDQRKISYYVSEGPCGFAWVEFKGNTKFARTVKKLFEGKERNGLVMYGNAYPTGKHLWITAFGQSYDRKSAMAGKIAQVLRERGYSDVYAGGRLD
jgi:hypothetical protein